MDHTAHLYKRTCTVHLCMACNAKTFHSWRDNRKQWSRLVWCWHRMKQALEIEIVQLFFADKTLSWRRCISKDVSGIIIWKIHTCRLTQATAWINYCGKQTQRNRETPQRLHTWMLGNGTEAKTPFGHAMLHTWCHAAHLRWNQIQGIREALLSINIKLLNGLKD